MSSGSEFQTTGPETTETPRPEATGLGSRHSQVALYSWPQMSSGIDLPDRCSWGKSGLDHGRRCGQRPWSWIRSAGEWEASGVGPSTQEWYGQTSSCSRSAWQPHWGQIEVDSQQCLWHRKRCCCSNRHNLIWENGPVFLRHPWRVIVGWISAVWADRNSFEWCYLHAGPCRMSRRDSWRRSKIRYGVHRLSWSLCRSSPAVFWIQATRIESCRSSVQKYGIPVSSIAGRSHLRSAASLDLFIPATNTVTIGPRAFAVAYPAVWNSLPTELHDKSLSLMMFLKKLKTYVCNS